jgi:predicted RNase H-like HicB family nuclease
MARTYRATILKREKWWVAWSEDVPGALTQGRTLLEAKSNLRDAIRLMLEPIDLRGLPKLKVIKDRIRA